MNSGKLALLPAIGRMWDLGEEDSAAAFNLTLGMSGARVWSWGFSLRFGWVVVANRNDDITMI